MLIMFQIWETQISEFMENSSKIFGQNLSAIQSQDFKVFISILPVKDLMKLQHLFFLTKNDLSNGILVHELALSSLVTINKLPSMKEFKNKRKKTHIT